MNFKKTTIAGGGVLGSQIAFQTAFKGFDVKIWLRSEGSIGRTQPKIETVKETYLHTLEAMKTNPAAYCRGLTDSKKLSDKEIDELKERTTKAFSSIKLTTNFEEAFKDTDFVIESIAEISEEKIAFYKEMSKYLPSHAVIATNSSTLLPSQLAEYTGRPEKYLAIHFANSIWRNNIAEIMGHSGTEQKYYDQVVDFANAIGMVPLKIKKEQAGYILNSMLVPFLNSAEYLLAKDVADIQTIDLTWKLGTGSPLGPFQILDIVGLTTAYNIVCNHPDSKNPETMHGMIAKKLKEYIDQGKTGISAGEGFYKYNAK